LDFPALAEDLPPHMFNLIADVIEAHGAFPVGGLP
jgi:hypothetical protein